MNDKIPSTKYNPCITTETGAGRQLCLTNCLRSAPPSQHSFYFLSQLQQTPLLIFRWRCPLQCLCLSCPGTFTELSALIHKSQPGREASFFVLGHVPVQCFWWGLSFHPEWDTVALWFFGLVILHCSIERENQAPWPSILMMFLISGHLFFLFTDWALLIFYSS